MGKADAANFFLLGCLQLVPQTFFAIIWVIVFSVPYLVQYILWGYRWALTAALSTFQFLTFQAIRQTIITFEFAFWLSENLGRLSVEFYRKLVGFWYQFILDRTADPFFLETVYGAGVALLQ